VIYLGHVNLPAINGLTCSMSIRVVWEIHGLTCSLSIRVVWEIHG
jgi:hypothetical protein